MTLRDKCLPTDEFGNTYVTDAMLEEFTFLRDFLQWTHNSWWRDEQRCRWVLYPTVGKS